MLSAGLASVASTTAGTPPAAVKTALLAEFRRQQAVVPIRRPVAKWAAIAAVAAALLLALFVAKERRPETAVTPGKAPLAAERATVVAPPITSASTPPVRAKAHPGPRRRTVKAPPAQVLDAPEVATDFFAIPYAEPLRPEERADVFRIQMPRAGMAVFGLPVTGGRLDSRITADVLMGEDGVARAIRFIR
jgi:hypothetical protein